jgi:DnaD/phage-associated family protein
MKIEQNDKSILFSETAIPDVFFTEYLSAAPGDYVKVYIYVYFIARYNKDIKINDLSKKLELPLKTIQDALKYWEDNELLLKKNQGYILRNIQEIELNKVYKPKVSLSAEDISKVQKNEKRAKAIETINNDFFQGVMSPSWYGDIDLWFNKYGFDEEVMIALFNYCYEKSALHRSYVETVAQAWNGANIQSFSDIDSYSQKQEKFFSLKKQITKKLRLNHNLTEYEDAFIEKWYVSYNYDMDVIDLALKKASMKGAVNFQYIDKIITDWNEHE